MKISSAVRANAAISIALLVIVFSGCTKTDSGTSNPLPTTD